MGPAHGQAECGDSFLIMKCTWVDCFNEASEPQLSLDGKEWSNLCADHATTLEDSIGNFSPGKLVSNWIKAHGGATALAKKL